MVEQHPTLSPLSKHSIFDEIFGSCTPLSGGINTPTDLEKLFQIPPKHKFKNQNTLTLKVPAPHHQNQAQRIYDQTEVDLKALIGETFPGDSFSFQEILSAPQPVLLSQVPAEKFQKKTLPKVKKEVIVEESDPSREFKRTFDKKHQNASIDIVWKTRNEPYRISLEERMYSSIKYEFKIKIELKDSKLPCILARAYLMDENSKISQGNIEGILECAMSEENNGIYEGNLRIQFSSSISFHHTREEYCIQIKFFNPKEVSEEIYFASLLSAPFKVFARKPNSKPSDEEKPKKRKIKNEPSVEPQQKKKKNSEVKKSDHVSSDFLEFSSCLEKLLEVKNKLNSEDQKIALNLVKLKIEELAASEDEQLEIYF
jgi:hypothetical protein